MKIKWINIPRNFNWIGLIKILGTIRGILYMKWCRFIEIKTHIRKLLYLDVFDPTPNFPNVQLHY